MRVIALTTCHNRREITLRCLTALQKQILPDDCTLDICVVDDGSSDGTREAVQRMFPSITVLEGPGDLFWAGGMRFGWERFAKQRDPDYLIVFNDDVSLAPDAVSQLLSTARQLEEGGEIAFAASGLLVDPDTREMTYGGSVRGSCWHPLRFRRLHPSEAIQDCDALNMNWALISRGALRRVGFLSPRFTHAKADYDFGLRLRAAGGRLVLSPGVVGECRVNPIEGTSGQVGLSPGERWRRLTGIKEEPPVERAAFYKEHGGWLWPVLWCLPYVRVALQCVLQSARKWLLRARPGSNHLTNPKE